MFGLLGIYTAILVAAVFFAVSLAQRFKLDHRRTQLVMSFVSGIMLGIAVFHLLPHAIYGLESLPRGGASVDFVAWWLMAGLIGMFLLQRLFHFHQHDFDDSYTVQHSDSCVHGHSNDETILGAGGSAGVFMGLAVHSMIDGLALAAAILADQSGHSDHIALAGVGVFLAIVLHKPLDAITIDTFARQLDITPATRKVLVLVYALLCPVVALLAILGFASLDGEQTVYLIGALAFSAGMFLCIALSDLLPEIHFHQHDRFSMTLALLAGIAISQGVTWVESSASHHLHLHTDHVEVQE